MRTIAMIHSYQDWKDLFGVAALWCYSSLVLQLFRVAALSFCALPFLLSLFFFFLFFLFPFPFFLLPGFESEKKIGNFCWYDE